MQTVIWLSDYDLTHSPGGAQRSDSILIKKGIDIGYDIFNLTHDKAAEFFSSGKKLSDYDILISSNLEAHFRQKPEIVNLINEHKRHFRVEHDMNRYLDNQNRSLLFTGCRKALFLTPFHLKLFKSSYGDIFPNAEIVYDPVDKNSFVNKNLPRDNKILYSGFMHDLKGTAEFFEVALSRPDLKFVVSGWAGSHIYNHLATSIPNVEFLGITKYEDMPDLYNKYEYFYYSPVIPEPFCRSAAEALLCGMKFAGNNLDRVGVLDELSKVGLHEIREGCHNAPDKFWKIISQNA